LQSTGCGTFRHGVSPVFGAFGNGPRKATSYAKFLERYTASIVRQIAMSGRAI
jgi:hypothetical protein